MLFIPILTVLLSQGLAASSYVVTGEDGYYRTWRSNSKVAEMNQWPSMSVSQMYFPFLQNFNPFSWWQPQPQPQPPMQQEDPDIKLIRDRQDAIFDILRCVAEEDLREVCKRMLGNAMRLFPDHQIVTNKPPVVFQISTSIDLEPLIHQKPQVPAPEPIQPKPSLLLPPIMQEKPSEIEITLIQPKPSEAEAAVLLPKPMETVLETMETRPKEDETVALETVPIKDEPETLPTKIEIPVDPVKVEMEPVASSSNSVEGQAPVTEGTLAQKEPAADI